jgi:hypothetical protein
MAPKAVSSSDGRKAKDAWPIRPKPPWIAASLIAFASSVAAAAAFIIWANRLARFGIATSVYYLCLVALGLCAGGFLFGALRSRAKYLGRHSFGTLELGGPAVVSVLILIIGLKFAGPISTTSLVVRIHGPLGPSQFLTNGRVLLHIGTGRQESFVDPYGDAHFAGISFIGSDTIEVTATSDGYATTTKTVSSWPSDGVIQLEMKPVVQRSQLIGTLRTSDGRPVKGATLTLEGSQPGRQTNWVNSSSRYL